MLDTHDLYGSRQARQTAGQGEGQRLVAGHVDAGIARRVGIEPDGADIVADGRAPEEQVDEHGHEDGHDHARMKEGSRHEPRQPDLMRQLGRLGEEGAVRYALGVHERSLQKVVHQLLGDRVHHDRAEDLVHAEPGLENARNEAPDGAGQKADDQGRGDEDPARRRPGSAGETRPPRERPL